MENQPITSTIPLIKYLPSILLDHLHVLLVLGNEGSFPALQDHLIVNQGCNPHQDTPC